MEMSLCADSGSILEMILGRLPRVAIGLRIQAPRVQICRFHAASVGVMRANGDPVVPTGVILGERLSKESGSVFIKRGVSTHISHS